MTLEINTIMDELDEQLGVCESLINQVYLDRDRLAVLLGLAVNEIAQSEHTANEEILQRFADFDRQADPRWHNRQAIAAEIRALVKQAYGDAA